MPKMGQVAVATIALILGALFLFAGVTFLVQGEDGEAASMDDRSFFDSFGETQTQDGMPTTPWMGVVFLVMGVALVAYAAHALYTTLRRGEAS